VWAYWGNPAAGTPDSATNGAVWRAGFCAVWHFGEAETARRVNARREPFYDGTPQNYEGSEDRLSGIVCGCDAFDGGDTLRTAGLAAPAAQGTVSLWLRTTTANRDVYETSSAGWNQNGLWFQGSDLLLRMGGGTPCPDVTFPAAALLDGRWHHVAAAWTAGGDRRLYVDGLVRGAQSATPAYAPGNDLIVGRTWRNIPWIGDFDEYRFSTAARSPAWIWAEWMNAASNHVFNQFGPVETVRATGAFLIVR
jgi:hypothetical protein